MWLRGVPTYDGLGPRLQVSWYGNGLRGSKHWRGTRGKMVFWGERSLMVTRCSTSLRQKRWSGQEEARIDAMTKMAQVMHRPGQTAMGQLRDHYGLECRSKANRRIL